MSIQIQSGRQQPSGDLKVETRARRDPLDVPCIYHKGARHTLRGCRLQKKIDEERDASRVVRVGDGPEGPLKTGGIPLKTCIKQNKTKHTSNLSTHTARPTLQWPPRPTRVAQSSAPSSKVRLARGLTPPRARSTSLEGSLPLERVPTRSRDHAPSSGLRLARGSLTGAPAPARGYEHLML
jgi:hypothetical protein